MTPGLLGDRTAPGPTVPTTPPTMEPTAGLRGGRRPRGSRLVWVRLMGPCAVAAAAAVAMMASYSLRATKLSRSRESRWCLSWRLLASGSSTLGAIVERGKEE